MSHDTYQGETNFLIPINGTVCECVLFYFFFFCECQTSERIKMKYTEKIFSTSLAAECETWYDCNLNGIANTNLFVLNSFRLERMYRTIWNTHDCNLFRILISPHRYPRVLKIEKKNNQRKCDQINVGMDVATMFALHEVLTEVVKRTFVRLNFRIKYITKTDDHLRGGKWRSKLKTNKQIVNGPRNISLKRKVIYSILSLAQSHERTKWNETKEEEIKRRKWKANK